jgi:oligo-1,6-glucosidase
MTQQWWKESVVYQIYPRSFRDSDGDGIGDLRGIIEKLDYLEMLGISVVWLSPVYESPNDDNGYDISDYQAIMDEFGTMADWDELLAGLHQRGIKLLMDLVVNHTSDEHHWFVESRKSKDNPYRDYYVWRPGRDGAEPNNWASFFGGSAWEYDATTDEYYLHLFSRKQPDLNWENPAVRKAIFDMMTWWLDKGIDGFRMDVINLISKVPELPDATPINDRRYQFGAQHFVQGPRLLEYLGEMKREVLSKYDVLTVGEAVMATTEHAIDITNEETGQLNMLFHFEHMGIDSDPGGTSKWDYQPWLLDDLKRIMTRWQKELEHKGWNSFYFSNHDQPRSVSRFGNDGVYRVESAKLLGTFLHMLHGTPYVYQGEEIGMTNVRFPTIDDYRDIETLNAYRELVEERGLEPDAAMQMIYRKSRDNARTPMQWDRSSNAGFTTGTPWIEVNPNYTTINVEAALTDPDSVFHYYRALIALRKAYPIIVHGIYDLIEDTDERVYAFTRTGENEHLLVILNWSADTPRFTVPADLRFEHKDVLISNYEVDPLESLEVVALRPYEARVYRLR